MLVEEIKINIKRLIEAKLSIESYFILECVYREDNESLEQYVNNVGKIDRLCFINLVQSGFLAPIDGDVTFSKLKLTERALVSLGYKSFLDHKRYFQELRAAYPKKAGGRRLHQDLSGCEKKYKSIIKDEEMHNIIIKCVGMYLKELKDTGRLEYIQLLSTWLNQRNYEQYLEDISNNKTAETNTYDAV